MLCAPEIAICVLEEEDDEEGAGALLPESAAVALEPVSRRAPEAVNDKG
jgi:hypothetical protein